MRFPAQLLSLLLCLATACPALAQRVFWNPAPTGDPADIQLVFENCTPTTAPTLPELPDDASLHYRGQSSQTQIINFSRTTHLVLTYRIQLPSARQVAIATFTVPTSAGELTVPTYATGTVLPGPETDIQARLSPRKSTLWAGEVFPLIYSIDVARRSFSNFADAIQWAPAPLVAEDWAEPLATETLRDGESRLQITFRTRAYAKVLGTLRLNALQQLVNLNLGLGGGGGFGGFFQQPRIEQVTLTTDRPEIQVQPLPLPAPASFIGAVGTFTLESKVIPETAQVGEPITWTLTLSGTGNWPDIAALPPRTVSADLQALQPPAKRSHADGTLFDGTLTEDVVLIPTRPGTYTLAPYTLHTFDPETGHYQRHHIPETTLTITPAATASHATTTTSPTDADTVPTPPTPPEDQSPDVQPTGARIMKESATPPAGLIREPLKTAHPRSIRPPSASLGTLAAQASLPLALLPAVWLALALRRARLTDPMRSRRAALKALPRIHAALVQTSNNPQILLLWQHLAALAHGLTSAAPNARDLPEDGEWRSLWTESERALYRETTSLPTDWLARAEAATAALTKATPSTRWSHALRGTNLLPWLFALALLFVCSVEGRAADGSTQNKIGVNAPFTLAQEDRWAEAAAYWSSAFVQNPRDEITRWNLEIALAKAGYLPGEIVPALGDSPRARFAQLASPSKWEIGLLIGTSLLALALLLPLLHGYGLLPRRSIKTATLTLATLGLLLGALALLGRAQYGLAAHPRAAIVWRSGTLYSIPTEADTAQQTVPLAAGAIGVAEKTYLGWSQLRFSNGQTGWTRQSELIALWEKATAPSPEN